MMSPKENSTRCTEGRSRLNGICGEQAEVRTQGRVAFPAGLARVNEAAQRSRQTQFTALLHHVDVEALLRSLRSKNTRATWRATSGTCVTVYIPGAIGLKQYGGRICRSQMVAYDR